MFNILISEKGGQPSKLEFRKGEILSLIHI